MLLDAASRRLVESFVSTPRRSDYANPRFLDAARAGLDEAASCRRGPRLRHALDLADPRRETAIESLSFGHMVLAGLPVPDLQPRIVSARGAFYPGRMRRSRARYPAEPSISVL